MFLESFHACIGPFNTAEPSSEEISLGTQDRASAGS